MGALFLISTKNKMAKFLDAGGDQYHSLRALKKIILRYDHLRK